MAYWTQQGGWQTWSLPTDAKTDYAAANFAGSFPHTTASAYANTYPYTNAANYINSFPANRPTTTKFWVKIDNNNKADISWSAKSGSGWEQKELSAGDDNLGQKYGFFDKLNDNEKEKIRAERNTLVSNRDENNADPGRRQAAATAYNQAQDAKRNADAQSYNNTQNTNRQNTANSYNQANQAINTKNTTVNNWSATTKNKLASAQKGSYASTLSSLDTATLNGLVNSGLMSQTEADDYLKSAADTFQSYYNTSKITKFDPAGNTAYDPPAGGLAGFDPAIYAQTNEGKEDLARWQKAQNIATIGGRTYPDLDIVGTYGQNTWLQWNYAVARGKKTADGKWITASQTQRAKAAEDYKEEAVTDAQYQQYRDRVMGLSSFTSLKEWEAAQDPEFLRKWVASLSPEDAADRADGYLTVPTQTQIPEALRNQAKMDRGNTILEGKLTSVLGAKEQEAADKFRSLTVDTFNETLKEYKKQRAKEQQFDFYASMPGFDEIFNMNQELSNSLLGDTGVGGILSLGGQDQEKAEDSLERQFSSITGIPSKSNSVYNWQKWFDETLTKRYEEGATFSDWTDATKQYEVDKEFAEDYVKRYLNPRFNTSRSMSEFMSYMDVTQGEENIFQTQSALNSLKSMADLRAQRWLDTIKTSGASGFDSEFYFNPSGGDVGVEKHALQTAKVSEDWDTAKKNGEQVVPGTNPPSTWNQLAYLHGYNINDKAQFAKLHYQVYGIHQGFDPARDKLSLEGAQSFIDNDILPAIANEKVNLGSVSFLNFVTPREYADKMLEGIDPVENKPEWEKVLESMGLSGKDMGIEEVKTYIEEAFQTGEATKIREAIKYLNEKKEKVTQEKLGVDYIQRPEDTAPRTDPTETQLYNVFKDAGFAGTEDDFYKEFMPDVNREDMELLTQAGQGFKEGSVFSKLSSSDPFESLGSIESLFGDEESPKETSTKTSSPTEKKSYFSLYDDDDDEDTTTSKSNAGQGFLGSFTSAFKGLTPKY